MHAQALALALENKDRVHVIPPLRLRSRTVGVCMAMNRLLGFHVVRSTKPVQNILGIFVGKPEFRNRRDPTHVTKHPEYPDPEFHLNYTQKYFFRHADLRHLRIEQFHRYLRSTDQDTGTRNQGASTAEDRAADDEEVDDDVTRDLHHRNYDELLENTAPGTTFPSIAKGVPGCKRRTQKHLGSLEPCSYLYLHKAPSTFMKIISGPCRECLSTQLFLSIGSSAATRSKPNTHLGASRGNARKLLRIKTFIGSTLVLYSAT